jgi:hypothetical protein
MTRPARTLGAMAVVEDAARVANAGSWIVEGMHGSSQVRSLVPGVFEDYARVFHPAARQGVEVGWREIATANGKVAHPAMQWDAIAAGAPPGLWDRPPEPDSLPPRPTRVLCELLAGFTRSAGCCWCAVWEGYASMVGLRSDATLPRLEVWNRPMIVACGPLDAVPKLSFTDGFADAAESYRSPGLWWPDDRAWCVATDVDMRETYLGASAACVDRLLADERLEVMRVTAEQDITWDSDAINRPR